MSNTHRWTVETNSADETVRLARQIGARLRGGEVIELISDLGGGKTTFVRGLAKGAGSKDLVSSPTFTISQEYSAGRLKLYHFDFYRLTEAGIVADELAEVTGLPDTVVVVEWGDIVRNVLPEDSLVIEIQATAEDNRRFNFSYADNNAYLVPKA